MSKGRQDEAEASEGAKWLAEERITREDLVLSAHPPRHSGTPWRTPHFARIVSAILCEC